ncbi:unnamed protein product [Timema podura]|uniref:Malonyl-CoA:ACP transacylase (MAT) domain-containing protein n=1 Tax=Timema podura TaxID=61482 RepID=A0ABN7NDU0_TIMPD|nr:unnamed protein product [Timema podura]
MEITSGEIQLANALVVLSLTAEDGEIELESQPVDVECVKLFQDLHSSGISNYNYRGYTILGNSDKYREIKIALVDFLKAINITPDGYVGHSVGELGCAYIDGCLTAEETILAAYYRGLASNETELIPGYMAAIGLGYKDVRDLCPPEIDVACHNSFNSSTISGPEELVKTFVQELTNKNIFARAVNVANIAYHSRYIKPAAPKLLEYLKKRGPHQAHPDTPLPLSTPLGNLISPKGIVPPTLGTTALDHAAAKEGLKDVA